MAAAATLPKSRPADRPAPRKPARPAVAVRAATPLRPVPAQAQAEPEPVTITAAEPIPAQTPQTQAQPPQSSEPEPQPAPPVPSESKYPVTLVLANDGYGGDNSYCVELTDAQIRRLLSDDETPRYIRLPAAFSQHVPGGETRWLRMGNVSEVHVGRGWEPPDEWEWMSSAQPA